MTTLITLFRRLRTLLWTAFSIVVILAAVIVGVGKLLMPYSEHYQPRFEAWLSAEFGRPVRLESFTGEWIAFGPRLSLKGMTLLPAAGAAPDDPRGANAEVAIESAALDIKPLNLLIPGRPLYNFRVIGADFELLHTADGQLKLSGLGVTQRQNQGSALRELSRVGGVTLEDSSLRFLDEKNGIRLGFYKIQGRLGLDGDEFSSEFQASLFDERGELVYGDIEATVLLVLGEGQKLEQARWQATARELMLAAFQARLPKNPFLPRTGWLNAEFWGDWSAPEGHRIKGAIDLKDARLVNDYQDLRIDRLNSRFDWRFSEKRNWGLDLADVLYNDGVQRWQAPRISLARDTAENLGLWISADELPLGVSLNLARDIMSTYGTPWPAFLPQRASGRALDFDLVLDSRWHVGHARGELQQAGLFDWDRWPDLRGLDGEVTLAKGSGQVTLTAQELLVDWPRMFRDQLSFRLPECRLDLRWGGDLQAQVDHCSLLNDDLAAEASMTISRNEGKPAVDINAVISRGKVGRAQDYLPEALLKDSTLAWLRKALRAGDVPAGRLQIRGDMDDWPFRAGEGRFEAVAQVENGGLRYLDDWPEATGVAATLRFQGTTMDVRGGIADIGGAVVETARARIPDLKQPTLEVTYESGSELPELLGYLRQSPLHARLGVNLSDYEFAGLARTSGTLRVPLGTKEKSLALAGRLQLADARFSDPVAEVTLDALQGELVYDENGFEGVQLDTVFRGYQAKLDVAAGLDRPQPFRVDLSGVFGVKELLPAFLYENYPALDQVTGASATRISLVVEEHAAGESLRPLLRVESELYGVVSGLPAPLDKAGDEAWPLTLRYPLSGNTRQLELELAGVAALRLDIPADDRPADERRLGAAVVHLGPGRASNTTPGRVRVEGRAARLDLDGWVDVIAESVARAGEPPGLELDFATVSVDSLRFMDRDFSEVAMECRIAGDGIVATFDAEDLAGSLRLTLQAGGMRSLTAEFERLVLGAPVSGGMDMDSDPADLPVLHLYVRSFQYLGMELGETRIEAYPTATGFHFEKVDASSDRLSVQASGDWSLGESGPRSDFDIHITSESLGTFLQSVDISSSMEGGQTLVDFNAWWPGSPANFALPRLNGQLEFSVVDGNISNAGAGGGRLLGLLSVQALPRRLALDFRDVFDSGFSFDQATGSFEMENGRARTDDALLKSSAANISISGTTDLVERRYDQLLTIRPGVGNTLPIIGALTAGPGGAAAGLALQGLLHNQLAEATKVRYRVTGPWDEPLFEPVEIELPVAEPVDARREVNEAGPIESEASEAAGEAAANEPEADPPANGATEQL